MLWFGTSWGAPICDVESWRPAPIGEMCLACGKPVTERDAGFLLPYLDHDHAQELRPWHRYCLFDNLFGKEVATTMEQRAEK